MHVGMYDCMRSESESELGNQRSGMLSLIFYFSNCLPEHTVTQKNTHTQTTLKTQQLRVT